MPIATEQNFTANTRSRQRSGTIGRRRRTTNIRSAYTGDNFTAQQPSVALTPLPTAPDSGSRIGQGARRKFNEFEGDPHGEFGRGPELDPALDPSFSSPELESQVVGDIFGPVAKGALSSGVQTGLSAHAIEGLAAKHGYNINPAELGAQAALRSLASPTTMASTFGRGLVSTGNLYNATQAAELAAFEPEALEDPARAKAMQQHAALSTYQRGTTWSGLTGLYDAAANAYASGRSQQQAEAEFDRARASTMAALDPTFGGGRFGTTEEAEAAAFANLQEGRYGQSPSRGGNDDGGYGGGDTDADAGGGGFGGSSTGSDSGSTGEASGQHDSSDNDAGWW